MSMPESDVTLTRIVSLLVVIGCLLSCTTSGPVAEPVLERTGSNMIRYSGPDLRLEISYTFATNNLGEPWLMLEVAMSGALRRATSVRRENIFVRTPSGERVALPGQKEFSSAFSEVQTIASRASIATEPFNYMKADRKAQILPFHLTPAITMRYRVNALDVLYVTDRDYYVGALYFPIRGGVKPGPWVLGVDLKESRVRIPFVLGEQESTAGGR